MKKSNFDSIKNISLFPGDDISGKNPTVVSLFSGGGGMDLGFIQAGYKINWANDYDKDAQNVYRLNIGDIDTRSIMDVSEVEIPRGDVLTAGFPCQPFSSAGNRKGVHDERGKLYKDVLRIIKDIKPKVIVLENVKGILSIKFTDGRKLIDVIADDIVSYNYYVNYKLLNASDYRVPQNRQRVILVGIRKDLKKEFNFPEKQSKEGVKLKNVLDVSKNAPNQKDWKLSPQATEMVKHIPEGGSWKDVPYEVLAPRFKKIRDNMKKYKSPNFYRRFSREEINGTITSSAQPENCGIIHPLENRRYTIREVARIQTFPDNFRFIDDTTSNIQAMYKVIGNAVPVRLAFVLASAIKEQIFD